MVFCSDLRKEFHQKYDRRRLSSRASIWSPRYVAPINMLILCGRGGDVLAVPLCGHWWKMGQNRGSTSKAISALQKVTSSPHWGTTKHDGKKPPCLPICILYLDIDCERKSQGTVQILRRVAILKMTLEAGSCRSVPTVMQWANFVGSTQSRWWITNKESNLSSVKKTEGDVAWCCILDASGKVIAI